MIVIQLTDEEAVSLRNLLDVAVRAAGMRAAEFAVVIDRKIMESAKRRAEVTALEKVRLNGDGDVHDVSTAQ